VRPRSKVWLEVKGRVVFGPGRAALIEAIDRFGSIREASFRIGIGYRKARNYIKLMEERLGKPLTRKTAGGRRGGGTELTEAARELLGKFLELAEGWENKIDERYKAIFDRPGGSET
jgi:molybdate transport system regulatory protein